jgi:CRP-like cAMP-binding protein
MAQNNDFFSTALYYKRLGAYALFRDIDQVDLTSLLGCIGARIEKYTKNTFVILDKDSVSCACLILEGIVAIIKEDEQGHQSLITYLREGDIFGETFALSWDNTSSVSYKTMTKCTVMQLSVAKILNVCSSNCPFHRRLISNMFDCITRKNAVLMRKVDVISRNTIRERVLTYLGEELEIENNAAGTPDNRKIYIPLNKTEMAQYLCVNRSSLVRELSAMRQEGLIEVKGHTYTL